MQIELIVGIDCTLSNVDSKLHLINEYGSTPYLDAI